MPIILPTFFVLFLYGCLLVQWCSLQRSHKKLIIAHLSILSKPVQISYKSVKLWPPCRDKLHISETDRRMHLGNGQENDSCFCENIISHFFTQIRFLCFDHSKLFINVYQCSALRLRTVDWQLLLFQTFFKWLYLLKLNFRLTNLRKSIALVFQ